MKGQKRILLGGAVFALMVLVMTQDAWAMTSFARKYQTTCITCHESYPTLNAVGEAYRINGYRFVDDELYLKQEPMEVGDEAHKRLWPESMWPGKMPQYFPISINTKWISEVNPDPQIDPLTGEREASVKFILPHELELMFGSTLGERISYYGDIIYVQEDFASDDMYSWVMLKAWIEFQDLFTENLFNLRVGTVGMHSMGLFTARNEQGLPFQPYLMHSWSMPDLLRDVEGLVVLDPNIKDFEGNTFLLQAQPGIELNGFGKRWMYYVGVVNGKIINPFGSKPEDDIFFFGSGYSSSTKDYYGGLVFKWGGLGFDGFIPKEDPAEEEAETKLPSEGEFWRDDSLTLSLFGYRGQGRIETSIWDTDRQTITAPHTKILTTDDFYRLGAGLRAKYKDLTLGTGYMFGNNDNPYGPLSDASVDSRAWFVEAYLFAYPWLIPYVRYDGLNFDDLPEEELLLDGEFDREILTVGFKTHIRANIHLRTEASYYIKDDGYDYGLDQIL